MAVVLLLPLVPVMHSTRSRGASWSHRPRPPTTGMPRASSMRRSSRYRLMPGDLMTTSQPARASRPPSGGGEHRAPGYPAGRWTVVDEHRLAAQGGERAKVGQALHAEAPQSYLAATERAAGAGAQVRPGDRRAHRHPG